MDAASFEAAILVVLACTLLGLLLLLVEVVLIPGLGAPGVLGTLFIVAGAAYAFWAGGALWGLLTLAGACAILGLALRALGFTLGPRVVLSDRLSTPPTAAARLLGREGVALTPLRPSGLARLDGRRIDVVSRSEYLEAGTPVVVASVESSRVLVDRLAAEAAAANLESSSEESRNG
jgi:membrane-bound serine protease (ClpP class)